MKEILPDIFAIEVPEDIELPSIYTHDGKNELTYWYDDGKEWKDDITLPPGSYEILFTTKDCSEAQAGQLPLGNADEGFGYKDYEGKSSGTFYADHSIQSLLRSHNLTGKNYLLIKKRP